jgi:hypothetical protein
MKKSREELEALRATWFARVRREGTKDDRALRMIYGLIGLQLVLLVVAAVATLTRWSP